jgi:hypothetical protein
MAPRIRREPISGCTSIPRRLRNHVWLQRIQAVKSITDPLSVSAKDNYARLDQPSRLLPSSSNLIHIGRMHRHRLLHNIPGPGWIVTKLVRLFIRPLNLTDHDLLRRNALIRHELQHSILVRLALRKHLRQIVARLFERHRPDSRIRFDRSFYQPFHRNVPISQFDVLDLRTKELAASHKAEHHTNTKHDRRSKRTGKPLIIQGNCLRLSDSRRMQQSQILVNEQNKSPGKYRSFRLHS